MKREDLFGEATFHFEKAIIGWNVLMKVEAARSEDGRYWGQVKDVSWGLTRGSAESRANRRVRRLRVGKEFVF